MIKELQSLNRGDFNDTIRDLQKEVDDFLEDEDLKWRQRAKMKWLREGDRNTRFFHLCANQRKQTNTIISISNGEGGWAQDQEVVRFFFHQYY